MAVKSYRDLLVWQKAMNLVVESYRLANQLPKSELYSLISQIQRAAISIPANIAEGHGRDHLGDYLRHLSIANGSLMELETHLLLIHRLAYLPIEDIEPVLSLTSEIGRMIAGLSNNLRKSER
jgi:four helix bundle protein